MPTFNRDGVELHYELDGAGPPVVLISGFGVHSNAPAPIWLRQSLAPRYTVLEVDNRGSGQTVTPDGASVTIDDMADDIAALIDHHRLGSVHVLGTSMGGMVAMMLALRYPQKLCSQVVAVSGAGPVPRRSLFTMESTRAMLDAEVPWGLVYRNAALYLLGEEAFENTEYMDAWVNAPPDPHVQTHAGYEQQIGALQHYDIRRALPGVTTPTLVISSPDDILMPPRYQDEIAELIPGAEIKRYSGGHGFMILPTHFGQFVEDVTAFWDAHA